MPGVTLVYRKRINVVAGWLVACMSSVDDDDQQQVTKWSKKRRETERNKIIITPFSHPFTILILIIIIINPLICVKRYMHTHFTFLILHEEAMNVILLKAMVLYRV